MRGEFTINGTNAYSTYKCVITNGGYGDIVQWPALKSYEVNAWHEYDGIEVDLAAPKLDSRILNITFARLGDIGGVRSLMTLLTSSAYHNFYFPDINRAMTLRLTTMPSLINWDGLSLFTLSFADDYPLQGYNYLAPSSGVAASDDAEIDGRPLTDYGMRMLEGWHSALRREPDVRLNLLRNINILAGVQYDGEGDVVMQDHTASLPILCRAANVNEFWRNWDALLYDITRPGVHALNDNGVGMSTTYDFAYAGMDVRIFAILPDNSVWCEANLRLRLLGNRGDSQSPYLYLRPQTIWTNPTASNDVLSNTSWWIDRSNT